MAKTKLSACNEELELGPGIAVFAESDRGCVLVAHSQIEGYIGSLIRQYFKRVSGESGKIADALLGSAKHSGQMAPLGNFSSRIKLARALGIVSRERYETLLSINALRVHCAHFPRQVLLSPQRVKAIAAKLEHSEQQKVKEAELRFGEMMSDGFKHSPARIMFVCIVGNITDDLIGLLDTTH